MSQGFIDVPAADILTTIESVLPEKLERMLFAAFIVGDASIECRVGISELKTLLGAVYVQASDAALENMSYQIHPYQANDRFVTFTELLMWWREVASKEGGASPRLAGGNQARGVAQEVRGARGGCEAAGGDGVQGLAL